MKYDCVKLNGINSLTFKQLFVLAAGKQFQETIQSASHKAFVAYAPLPSNGSIQPDIEAVTALVGHVQVFKLAQQLSTQSLYAISWFVGE